MKTCANCGGKLNTKNSKMGQMIYKCNKCGAFFIDRNEIKSYTMINEPEYANRLSAIDIVRVKNNKKNLQIIKKIFKSKCSSIYGLEIGSATGLFLKMAEKEGILIKGIEPMRESFIISKRKKLDVINGFFPQDLPEGEKYDLIVFNDTFEHIPDSRLVLNKCKECLKKEGVLVLNLPVFTGIIYKIASFFDILGYGSLMRRLWQIDTASPHLVYYDEKSLTKIAKSIGFTPIFQHGVRMKTYALKTLVERINVVSFNGNISKKLLSVVGYLAYPFMTILPADLKSFYYKKAADIL